MTYAVIPAKAGIQTMFPSGERSPRLHWIPAFAGMTGVG
jgi:hypothetical protein